MAQVGNNIVTTGLSGKLGDLIVFRNRGGKTIVATAPKKGTKEWTAAQEKHRQRFQEAVLYAKAAMANASTKEDYKAAAGEGQTAYNVAVADFLNAPKIEEIDISGYSGLVGSTIRVRATDDFRVAEVAISIFNADGSVVEQGMAVAQAGGVWWLFTATVVNSSLSGDKIVIRVSDLPGNTKEEEQPV